MKKLMVWAGAPGSVVLMVLVALYMTEARPAATGYAAKQLCSGILIAGLPENWLIEESIRPAVAPVSDSINITYDPEKRRATAELFGYESTAVYRGEQGCVVLPNGDPGQSDLVQRLMPSLSEQQKWPLGSRFESPLTSEKQQQISAALDQAFAEPADVRRETLAITVAYQGQLIAEQYQPPIDKNTPMLGWSMVKSLLATWVGMQQQRGLMALDQSVKGSLPQDFANSDLSDHMTLKHLINMESGLDFKELYEPGDDVTQMLYHRKAMWKQTASRPQLHQPGSHWNYSSGDSNLVAYLWQKSLLGEDYNNWLAREFWQPLNIRSARIESDFSGVPVASSYGYLTARDWLRVGQFWLDAYQENHSAGQPQLPQGWMQAALQPAPSNSREHYGLSFWLNNEGDQGKYFPSLPESLFWARGHEGQYVMVIPEYDLVITRFGMTPEVKDEGFEAFVASLIEILNTDS